MSALIADDEEQMRRLLQCGQDMDECVGPWASSLLRAAWLDRGMSRIPFVLCTNKDETLRPSPLHIAIIFNSWRCLITLVAYGVSQDSSVWFGDVLDDPEEQMLKIDQKTAETRPTQKFSVNHLVQVIADLVEERKQ